MAPYSFTRAKELGILQPKEIERFAILYMYMHEEIKPSSEAMKIAAIQSGNTEGSFREALRVTLKKLKDKECFVGEDEHVAPAETPKAKATPRKRKAAGDGEQEKSAKKGKKSKKVKEEQDVEEKKDSGASLDGSENI